MIQYSKPNIRYSNNIQKEISNIISSGQIALGKNTEKLEEYFKNKFKVKYAISCANATNGLTIALKASGLSNKKILLPSFTWPSTLYAINCTNNTPVFCDINKNDWIIDLNSIDKEYDVVMSVDTFGAHRKINTDKELLIDAAHAFNIPNLGNRGLFEVVSLSFTKVVTGGDGGIILSNSDDLGKKALELRRLSSRMNEISALLALDSINNYKSNQDIKKFIIGMYRKRLNFEFTEQINQSNYSVYGLLLKDNNTRDRLYNNLMKEGIETKVYYDPLISGLNNTDDIYSRIICLPIYTKLITKIEYLCDKINKAYNK